MYPIADGTFIQSDLVESWSDREWLDEFKYLMEIKMHYIIIGTSENTKVDVVDMCLKNALICGLKVFISINYNSSWWEKGSKDEKWLYEQMRIGGIIADQLYNKYHHKYRDSFYGWYFVYEVDNMNFNTREKFIVLSKAINILLSHMRQKKHRLPLLISPFMNSAYGNAKTYADNWAYLFTHSELGQGDIFCPQDSVGGGGLKIDEVEEWFSKLRKAVDKKPGLLFWANTETFDHTNWCSAPLKRFVHQMKIESRYVDNIITFAYSHYYSPNNIDKRLHEIYLDYTKTGCLVKDKPSPPKNICVKRIGLNKFKIIWNKGESNLGIFGYELYRNGKRIFSTFLERKYGGKPSGIVYSYIDTVVLRWSFLPIVYEIRSIDLAGNVSDGTRYRVSHFMRF